MVMSYPEVIRNNMGERLAETNTPYLCPFLPLHDKKRIAKRLIEELKAWNLPDRDIKKAAMAAWDEEEAYKQKISSLTQKILDDLKKNDQRAIVLCGRPYHVDPEINHGIPELINSLGLAVLTEDGVASLSTFDGNLRVVDQWSYHSRLYRAAQYVTQHPNLELVELNSFGCGLDAIVADQVQDILAHGHKIHTLLKIDEGSNLGAIRIRLRSLLFVMNHRPKEDYTLEPYSYEKTIFTKEDAKKNVILAPSMTPIHFPMLMSASNTKLSRRAPAPSESGSHRHRPGLHPQRCLLSGHHEPGPDSHGPQVRQIRFKPYDGHDFPDRRLLPGHELYRHDPQGLERRQYVPGRHLVPQHEGHE